jgi:HK97 gp10 family phage protein
MSASVDFDIQGLDELEDKLRRLGNDLSGDALYGALFDAAKPVVDAIKQNAPKSTAPYYRYYRGRKNRQTGERNKRRILMQGGTLRASITRKRIKKLDVPAVAITVKNRAFYWIFFEYGTSTQPARPFMRPAFDAQVGASIARFSDRLRKRIARIAARQSIDLTDGAT